MAVAQGQAHLLPSNTQNTLMVLKFICVWQTTVSKQCIFSIRRKTAVFASPQLLLNSSFYFLSYSVPCYQQYFKTFK